MILTLANQKGGVGKTTLAINLACLLAETTRESVTVCDLDPQESAASWSETGGLPVKLQRGGEMAGNDSAFIIVDTPGNLHAVATQKAIQAADVILIPCGSSPQDIEPTRRTIAVVKELSPAPCMLVLNRVRIGTITAKAAETWSTQFGIQVANTRIRARQVFEQTVFQGWVSKGEAGLELQQLLIEILNLASRNGKSHE